MASVTIDLPDDIRRAIDANATAGGYDRTEDYLRDWIVAAAAPVSEELEGLLLRRLSAPGRVMTDADWDEQRRKFIERHERERQ
jgi:hypothetical protein